MNIVISLVAQENNERQVIRFKKIPIEDESSRFILIPQMLHKIRFRDLVTLNDIQTIIIKQVIESSIMSHSLKLYLYV